MNPPVTNAHARRPPNTFGSVTNLFAIAFVAVVVLFALDMHRVAFSAAVVWLGAFLLVGCGPVPRWLATSLQRNRSAERDAGRSKRIVIVLLGDGVVTDPTTGDMSPAWLAHSRIAKAAQVYLAGRARGGIVSIIVTGDDSAGKRTPSAYVTTLVMLGVAESDILLETRGRNTYHQAEHTRQMLQPIGAHDALLLVTSGLHMKRALSYFQNVGLAPQPVPSDYVTAEITLFPAAYNFAITDIACHQYIGMARMRLYNALGWNK